MISHLYQVKIQVCILFQIFTHFKNILIVLLVVPVNGYFNALLAVV